MTRERKEDFFKMPSFAEMKEREESWKKDFFTGLNQLEVSYEDYPAKCPTRYMDQTIFAGVFLAKTRALKRHVPEHSDLRPAQIVPGICPIAILAAANRATDIGPYNAIGTGFMIKNPSHLGYFSPLNLIPGFEFIRQGLLSRKAHSYVWRIADDSYVSYVLGYEFFGMPKFQSDVYVDEESGHFVCSAMDGDELILRLRAKKIRVWNVKNPKPMFHRAYFVRDNIPMTEEIAAYVKKIGFSLKPGDLELELGPNHPMADELRDVLVSTKPVGCMYATDCNAVIYEPGRWAPDVLEQLIDAYMEKREGQ